TTSAVAVISSVVALIFFFFFQAEDGIRDFHVTGVQTCALPIRSPTVPSTPCRPTSVGNTGIQRMDLQPRLPDSSPTPTTITNNGVSFPNTSNPTAWSSATTGPNVSSTVTAQEADGLNWVSPM